MKNTLKRLLSLILCLPVLLLVGCGSKKPSCKVINDLSYYYQSTVSADIFNVVKTENDESSTPGNTEPTTLTKKIELSTMTSSKLKKERADAFAALTIKAKSAEVFHLYIEYIYFKVYTNQTSEFPLDINITVSNVIYESEVGNADVEENTFSNTYQISPKKGKSYIVKAKVGRVVATATGSQIVIDVLTSDMFAQENSSFKWMIYDFKIYGESRAY